MTLTISRDDVFYAFSPELKPIASVNQGEEFILETHDCFQGQLKSSTDLVATLDWEHVNPATGPVFIRDTHPGDVLRLDLLSVESVGPAVMALMPGEGTIGNKITQMETIIFPQKDDQINFKDKFSIPKQMMIGVIGIAPAAGKFSTGTSDKHGGNMDCNLIGCGARLYLTVGIEGALVGAGDFHAVMGDGEVEDCGAETAGIVKLKAQTVALPGLPTPIIETKDVIATIYSAKTSDEAYWGATQNMHTFLTNQAGLPSSDASSLMSLVGQLRFCQVVDPAKTVRFEFPKWVLEKYNYRLPE